ncbi:MAG TPA: phosphotransferase [Kofleriaceae bacterium]|nr:phosphotransferase [Kofleriaceae bacterium]
MRELFPGSVITAVEGLAPDAGRDQADDDETLKTGGYGEPARITLRARDGSQQVLVWHTATPNEFGHDRRSDRAQQMLLAFDTFDRIPGHVRALDVGAVLPNGQLVSLRRSGEFYLLTSWAPGVPYAEDLRRIAREGQVASLDINRCDALAGYLAALHVPANASPALYTRAVRDLVGHGEGIFGLIDAYPPDTPSAAGDRLRAIERQALEWRWRRRGRASRLARIPGDFHPFNVLFGEDSSFTPLDASRGCVGDPADDVTCMSLNYVFFALDHPASWRSGLGSLWRRFWRIYQGRRADPDLLDVAPPYLAWRALVMACPRFYPDVTPAARDALLGLAERALEADRFDPDSVEALFP